ncbi:MAG: hypothetical protein KKB50_01645 [Planctomycetes bacterium]|nr:hypothetical protein [Planctomycetota bacterium]
MRFRREQFIEIMRFGRPARPMFSELFGLMVGVADEWRAQGATPAEISLAAFDWDYVPHVHCGANCGALGQAAPVTLHETDEYVIQRDYLGRTTKLYKAAATLPLPLDYPVQTADDWLGLKGLFEFGEQRVDTKALEVASRAQVAGTLVLASIPGGWDVLRELMGAAPACRALVRQPELIRDILQTVQETCLRVLERVTERLTIDQLSVHEDMAGKDGPLIGPRHVAEFIAPYYRAVWDLVSSRGTPIFNQDSDGNMNQLIDGFLDCGVNVMHPFEPAAGMDMVAARQQYGDRLGIIGGIDKHVLRQSQAEIRRELEYKLQPLMQTGGTVFGLDHRVPNGTPLENYRFYVQVGREILGLPPLDARAQGWGRMAF